MKCQRANCNNELKTGRKYCSSACANKDRYRPAEDEVRVLDMPESLAGQLSHIPGAGQVIDEARVLLEEKPYSVPVPVEGVTYGDWVLSFDGMKDMRPSTTLRYDIINRMVRSGPVVFTTEMKRAQVYRVFHDGRYKVISPDKELAEVAEASLRLIMAKMAQDITWSMFIYGSSFSEEVWERKTKYELGMARSAGNKSTFMVPRVPNSVNPETVDHIRRTADHKFNGFIQKPFPHQFGNNDIVVSREASLVVPLNERFRNLWGQSFLHSLYPIWLWYEIIFRALVRYMERMAMPVTVAKAPSRDYVTMGTGGAPVKAMDLALVLAANAAKSNAIAIPSDLYPEGGKEKWSLGYLTADERSQPFIQVLEFIVQEMIRAGLSADRSLSQASGGVGSYNIGELHAAASAMTSEMILMQMLHYLNMYFMPEFSLYNRGPGGPPIWLKTQAIDNQERQLLMQLIGVAGNSPGGQEFFNMIDFRVLGETGSVPLLSEEEVAKQKETLQQESMDKQRQQQELLQEFQDKADSKTPDNSGVNPKKPSPFQAPRSQEKNGKVKTEVDYHAIIDGLLAAERIPWITGSGEVTRLLEAGVIDKKSLDLFYNPPKDAYKLYNPLHDRLGRFSDKRGSGSAAGGGASQQEGNRAVTMATSSPGSLVKVLAAGLGLGGLGIVALSFIPPAREGEPGLERGDSVSDLIEKGLIDEAILEEHGIGGGFPHEHPHPPEDRAKIDKEKPAELPEGVPDFGQYATLEEAEAAMKGEFEKFGIELGDISSVEEAELDIPNAPGFYNPASNAITLDPGTLGRMQSGDMGAWDTLTHEYLHSVQDGGGAATVGSKYQYLLDSGFIGYTEGQNELLTRIVLSSKLGKPIPVSSTYDEYTKMWAGLALAGSKKNNQEPIKYLIGQHKSGFDNTGQYQELQSLFPDRLPSIKRGSYGQTGGLVNYPSYSEVQSWLKEDYGIDSQDAYDVLLQEGVDYVSD